MLKTEKNFELKKASWIKIGGPAKEFIETADSEEFKETASRLIKDNTDFEILGWGANTLIHDKGLDCVVIKDKSNVIEINSDAVVVEETDGESQDLDLVNIAARLKVDKEKGTFFGMEYDDINYTENDAPIIKVKLSAGVGLPYAINVLIDKGITGLQMFSGIPGTIGGSVYNNIHGGPRLLSDFIDGVEIINEEGKLVFLDKKDLNFDYNQTPFQHKKNIIVSVVLKLRLGDKNRARHAAVEWAKRKSVQPKNSLGSTFHNLTDEEVKKNNLPMPGAGYLIDKELKLGGMRVGDIMIPDNMHRNMFVNLGNGTASDYLALMKKVYYIAFERFGIRLKPEIFFKGFSDEEIKEFL